MWEIIFTGLGPGVSLMKMAVGWPLDWSAEWPERSRQMFIESCPKMILLEKWKILTPLQKIAVNVNNWGNIIVAKGFEKLPKGQ